MSESSTTSKNINLNAIAALFDDGLEVIHERKNAHMYAPNTIILMRSGGIKLQNVKALKGGSYAVRLTENTIHVFERDAFGDLPRGWIEIQKGGQSRAFAQTVRMLYQDMLKRGLREIKCASGYSLNVTLREDKAGNRKYLRMLPTDFKSGK